MKWLVIAMVLVSGFALNYSYDGLIYSTPGKSIVLPIHIQSLDEEGLYEINCFSKAKVNCPGNFFVSANKEQSFDVLITPELGSQVVNIKIGSDFLKFEVIGSTQTEVFLTRLKNYDDSFFRLEKTYGEHTAIDDAKLLIREGYIAYGLNDFDAMDGITRNLGSILSNYYDTLDPIDLFEEETPSKLNFSVIPLLLLVSFVVILYIRPKKEIKRTYVDELTSLVKKEEYNIGIR
ncbi:MAG: hypothetical protein GOU98_04100 [Candidatus Altiarchaeota archaeon]|nr:hypothetical protein [Candidatus Altiarchaeota archaeon]